MSQIVRLPSILVLLVMGLLAGPVEELRAQDTTAIDLREAIDLALRQNLDLRQAEQQVVQAAATRDAARLELLPSVSAYAGGSQNYGLSFDETVGELTQQQTRYARGGVSASLSLFDGFRTVANLRESGSRLDAAEHDRVRARQTVVHTTIDRFLQVARAREVVRIRERALEAQHTQREQVASLVEAGRRPQADLLRQEELVATARVNVLQARQQVETSRARLVETLSLDPFAAYRFDTPGSEDLAIDTSRGALRALVERAVGRRPDLAAERARVQAAEAGVRASRAQYWPSISLSGGLGTSYTSAAEQINLSDQIDRNRSGSIGLNVSIPLTGWFSANQQAQRASAARRSAELREEALRQRITTQVKEAYLNYRAQAEQLEAGEARLRAAEAALGAERERYRLGRSTVGEVADAQASYVEARSELARIRYELLVQEATLAYQTGAIDSSILHTNTASP